MELFKRRQILDTREYIADFGDGNYAEYSANVLLETLHDQVDLDGRTSMLMKGIITSGKMRKLSQKKEDGQLSHLA